MHLSISFEFLNGAVGGMETIISGILFSVFFKKFRACCQANHSGDLSEDKYFGLLNKISAPYFLASAAIFSLSVDIIILFKTINVVLLRKNIVIDRNSLKVDDLGEDKNEK